MSKQESVTIRNYKTGERILARAVTRLQRRGLLPPGEKFELKPEDDHVYKHTDFEFDRENGEISVSDKSVHLAPREALLLDFLSRNEDRTQSRQQIFQAVWGVPGEDQLLENVKVYVYRLRKRFKSLGIDPQLLRTYSNFGVSLHRPTEEEIERRKMPHSSKID